MTVRVAYSRFSGSGRFLGYLKIGNGASSSASDKSLSGTSRILERPWDTLRVNTVDVLQLVPSFPQVADKVRATQLVR